MKPIKVDKETQKLFEGYGEFQRQNDGLMNTLIDTMNRINCRLSEANRSVWEPTSKKYKLDPAKPHVYDSERKEITERVRKSDAEAQKDEEWLKREEEALKGYNKLLETAERLAENMEPGIKIRLKADNVGGGIHLKVDDEAESKRVEKSFYAIDANGQKLASKLKKIKQHDVIELVFKEKG